MACPCTDNSTTSSNCQPCNTDCADTVNSICIAVNSSLPNLGTDTNAELDDVLVAIDTALTPNVLTKKITIPSANIKVIAGTPYVLVSASGSNTFIQILEVSARMSGTLSTPYTVSAGTLVISANGAGNGIVQISDSVLTSTDNTAIHDFIPTSDATLSGQVNTSIVIYEAGGNPTLGTGDLLIYITYKIINI